MTDAVLLEQRDGALLTLTLNRPDRLNAINGELMDTLLDATQRAAADNSVRAVVLTGAGRAFCAGGDVRDGARPKKTPDPKPDKPRDKRQERIDSQFERTRTAELLHTMPKPTVALVRGAAMGAGMSLALACDYTFISENAVYRTAFVNNALSGDYGMGYFLAAAVGTPRARALMALSEKLDAQSIMSLGLALRCVADTDLEQEGMEFARQLASGPTVAYAGIKRSLVAAQTLSLSEYLRTESEAQVDCSFTEDIREAARAFMEKRAPQYRGR